MTENRQRSQVTEDEKFRIMKEIETTTQEIVKTVILSEEIINTINVSLGKTEPESLINQETRQNLDDTTNILQNIMRTGANEFKEKVGRHMTYSEMREMFG
jgi:hypothetical protein